MMKAVLKFLLLQGCCIKCWHDCYDGLMQKLVEEQLALKRIADVAIELFAITSVLARASRSKSIGLQHCDHEVGFC